MQAFKNIKTKQIVFAVLFVFDLGIHYLMAETNSSATDNGKEETDRTECYVFFLLVCCSLIAPTAFGNAPTSLIHSLFKLRSTVIISLFKCTLNVLYLHESDVPLNLTRIQFS